MFNEKSRLKNLLLSSSFGVMEQVLTYFLAFVYRTVFLMVLSKEYLGITGLFSNVLQVFSLTELGIGSVIAYRLYKPIKENDCEGCHALMAFYRNTYHLIALVVFLIGCVFYPFLDFLIADASEVPSDVNLSLVYWLFVLQSVVSYLFVYTQSLLAADQKNYVISFANSLYNIISTVAKILVLVVFHSYIGSLITGIAAGIVYNVVFARIIKNEYQTVFGAHTELTRVQKFDIIKDTFSLMCHKIGYVVLNSTDSIILSKFKGLAILGIYSNYALVSGALDAILNKLLGSFVATIGNLSLDKNDEKTFGAYKKLTFINFWLVSFCTVCFFSLINPFIRVWLEDTYILDCGTVIVISCNLFFNSSGITNGVFTNANGLFVKDRIRPLFQAVINLVVSIVLVKLIGVAGVFIGTLVSNITTVWWRQPIIVFRNIFGTRPDYYFGQFLKWFLITIGSSWLFFEINVLVPATIIGFVFQLLVTAVMVNLLLWMLFRKDESFKYYKELLISRVKRLK